MAQKPRVKIKTQPKKTSIGHGKNRKYHNKGSVGGSTTSKNYSKRYRGQGK